MAKYSRLRVLNTMIETGLVPVFYNPDVDVASKIVEALAEAGVRCFEFVNRGDQARYSSAFFYSPDLGTRLDPLPVDPALIASASRSPRHRDEGLMASRAELLAGVGGMASHARPEVFGERYWQRWVRSYPEIARSFYPHRVD